MRQMRATLNSYKACRAVGLAEAGPIRDASVWVVSASRVWGPSRVQGTAERSIEQEHENDPGLPTAYPTSNLKLIT
jgi:hypothetical protein